MLAFLKEKILTLGTAACPPYHLAIVIGGTSAELTMKTVKLASTKYLDELPTQGSEDGHAFRDLEMEQEILKLTQSLGVGAQFGGKYFCHDVRVIRLPRHGASLPIGLGVSCSADRQALGKITRDGVFLEELEHNPAKYLPEVDQANARRRGGADRPQPADEGDPRAAVELSDQDAAVAHRPDDRRARSRARQAARAAGERAGAARLFQEPSGLLRRPGQDAGRATPRARSGRPRRGAWIRSSTDFQAAGGSMVMLAKGNRSPAVRDACKKHGGFYLASIGGSAANLAEHCIKKVEVLEYPELGMEAIWRIEVENFPAFIVIDDKGNDFFKELNLGQPVHPGARTESSRALESITTSAAAYGFRARSLRSRPGMTRKKKR